MTILEAITSLDAHKHNTYTVEDKIEWLSRLDGMIKAQIIDTHEGGEKVVFHGYDANTNRNTVLLVGAPWEDIYLRWMEAQIDYHNGENKQYNTSIIQYNTVYAGFADHYNRTHMPLSRGKRFVF